MLTLRLATKPGQRTNGAAADVYYVWERRGTYVLQTHDLAPLSFASLDRLAHTLGGMVPWDRWSEDAQVQLDHLKLRGAFT
jgi:hypothetical protein